MSVFQRKYGVGTVTATHITIPIVKAGSQDFAVAADWAKVLGDVKFSKDGAAAVNLPLAQYDFVADKGWVFQFLLADLQAKRITILIVDLTATKTIDDQFFIIETFGNASAMFIQDISAAEYQADVAKWLGTDVTAATAGLPDTNNFKINNSLKASQVLSRWMDSGHLATVQVSPAPTTTSCKINFTEPNNQQLVGNVISFPTSASLDGANALIIAYDKDTQVIIFSPPLPVAPSSGDPMVLIPLAPLQAGIGKIGYPDSRVIVDQTASNTNTIIGVDGTTDNPVSTLAAAKTLADQLGKRLTIHGVFSSQAVDFSDYDIIGGNGNAALAGDATTGVDLSNARVSGMELVLDIIFDAKSRVENCHINDIADTVSGAGLNGLYRNCRVDGASKVSSGARLNLVDCFGTLDSVGESPAQLDLTGVDSAADINISRFAGQLIINNATNSLTDLEVYSNGATKVSLAASNTAGVIRFRGLGNILDSSSGMTVDIADWEEIPLSGMSTNLTKILGTDITEGSAGDLADAFTKFLDVATATKDINDIGNLDKILGTLITESGAGDVADAFTTFLDVATATKDINDIGDLRKILGTLITESGAGEVADAFTKFLDVATATKDINDIGDLRKILGTLITESGAGDVADAFTKFLDVATATKDINNIGLVHSVKRNTAVPGYKIVMISSTTGNPVAGLLPILAERKLDADLVWTTMTGPKVDNGFGAYSIDINAVDTDGLTGVWKFTADGAETTFITFITEVA